MRVCSLLLVLLGAGVAAPSAAAAAGPWSEPQTLVQTDMRRVGWLRVPFDGRGAGSVLWGEGAAVFAAPVDARGLLGPPRLVAQGAPFWSPDVAAGGRLVIAEVAYEFAARPIARVVTGVGIGPAAPLALRTRRAEASQSTIVAVDDDLRGGSVLAAAPHLMDVASGRVRLARRRSGAKAFGPWRTVAPPGKGVESLAVAVDRRGLALVAWERAGRIEARFMPRRGKPSPIRRLARARGTVRQLRVALGARGTAVVAWSARGRTEKVSGRTPTRVSASLGSARTGLGRARTLAAFTDNDTVVNGMGVDAVVAGRHPIVAWSHPHATRAAFGSGKRFGIPFALEEGAHRYDLGGGLAGLDATERGDALAIWDRSSEPNTHTIMAAHLAPGTRAFGPAETISEPVAGEGVVAGALNRRDGSAVVAWLDSGNALGERDTIRFATRPGR